VHLSCILTDTVNPYSSDIPAGMTWLLHLAHLISLVYNVTDRQTDRRHTMAWALHCYSIER